MSDTPETDKVEQYVLRDINRKWVLSDFAKRIERERDEARKKLEQSEILRDEIYEAAKSENERHIATAAERDEARALFNSSKRARQSLNHALDKTMEENRKLRAEVERLKWRLNHCAENIGDLVAIKFATSATDAEIDSAMKGNK
jgi:predicted  nucleic acid-binding Zn-ribbon protein